MALPNDFHPASTTLKRPLEKWNSIFLRVLTQIFIRVPVGNPSNILPLHILMHPRSTVTLGAQRNSMASSTLEATQDMRSSGIFRAGKNAKQNPRKASSIWLVLSHQSWISAPEMSIVVLCRICGYWPWHLISKLSFWCPNCFSWF